jgi:TonB family protein
MRKDLRVFSSIALIFAMVTSTVVSMAQERQQSADRVLVEKQRSEPGPHGPAQGPERIMIEQDAMRHGPHGPGAGDFIFLATEMSFGGKLVKGAPYSAQAVTESVQTMIDGNRIVNKSSASVYRDSEGRTRREQTLKAIGPYASGGEPPTTIFINDPVAGTSYTLDPRSQTARKMSPLRFRVTQPKTAQGEAKTAEAKEAEVRHRPGATQVVLERSPASSSDQYKIAVEATSADSRRNLEAGVAMGLVNARNRTARTESMGKQNIGGVEAEGTRSTITIPAGEIGNERPIEIVSERWYSPELQLIVMTRHTDPRFGENSYQLTNIDRNEPARELFEVPPGYTVRELPEPVTGVTSFGGGGGAGAGTAISGAINGGVLNGKATALPIPEYPEIARQASASGTVVVQVMIDEGGNVISATPVSGHPLLRAAAVKAAREAKFSPTRLSGQPVKVSGVVTYTFAAQ